MASWTEAATWYFSEIAAQFVVLGLCHFEEPFGRRIVLAFEAQNSRHERGVGDVFRLGEMLPCSFLVRQDELAHPVDEMLLAFGDHQPLEEPQRQTVLGARDRTCR
jgi:hypothetical protein